LESIGPVLDHDIKAIPAASIGPMFDGFLGVPALIKHGPIFDHEIEALSALPAHGPISDAYSRTGITSFGSVFDHIVAGPPPPLSVRTPESVIPPVVPRNVIEPETVEFKSPGVYKLEKDPDGKVTGFKY
jgi:hypothetical protein